MTTNKAGFYGTDNDTCYVTPAGRVYLVASNDMADSAGPELLSGLPDGATPCDDLVTPEEAIGWVREVEAESGETLLESA